MTEAEEATSLAADPVLNRETTAACVTAVLQVEEAHAVAQAGTVPPLVAREQGPLEFVGGGRGIVFPYRTVQALIKYGTPQGTGRRSKTTRPMEQGRTRKV